MFTVFRSKEAVVGNQHKVMWIRCELVDISGTKKKAYLKAKMNETATNGKKKNIGDL